MKSKFTLATRLLAPVMATVLVMLSCTTFTGCTPAQLAKAVQNAETGFKTAQSALPALQLIATQLQQTDPGAAAVLFPVLNIAGPGLDKLIAASETYLANPGNDNFQALLNLSDAITSQIDQQALQIARIQNPDSQTKAMAWIVIFSTGLHLSLGLLENYASKKQIKAMPAVAQLDPQQLRQFINRDYARRQLAGMGYNPDAALRYAGF